MTILTYEKYNKNKFAVRGDMEKHQVFVKSLNGRVNKRMKGGEGWLVNIKYEKELEEFVRNQQEDSDTDHYEDNKPLFRSENVYEERFEDDLSSGISTITEESENVVEIYTDDDITDDSVFKELEEREKLEKEEFEREKLEKEEFEREKLEKEEFEREKLEKEEFERERESLKKEREELEIKKEIFKQEIRTEERENIDSSELQEILEYYRKFSKPNKPKKDKNYIVIVKIINKLNTRVTNLEHKYQKLKRKYYELKSSRIQ